jgi:hypothetical protein
MGNIQDARLLLESISLTGLVSKVCGLWQFEPPMCGVSYSLSAVRAVLPAFHFRTGNRGGVGKQHR